MTRLLAADLFDAAAERAALRSGRPKSQERAAVAGGDAPQTTSQLTLVSSTVDKRSRQVSTKPSSPQDLGVVSLLPRRKFVLRRTPDNAAAFDALLDYVAELAATDGLLKTRPRARARPH